MKPMLCMMLAASSIMAATAPGPVDQLVQASREQLPVVWDAVKKRASAVPLTKRKAWKTNRVDPRTGRQYQLVLPPDLYRNYDEAYIGVLERRQQLGHRIPKRAAIGGQLGCLDSNVFGVFLGFVYGLQYDTKAPGECFNNLENSILALDTLYQLWWLVLLPTEWPKVMLAQQDMVTVVSALYGNC